jgi:tetratricopeptide repeat protein 21B
MSLSEFGYGVSQQPDLSNNNNYSANAVPASHGSQGMSSYSDPLRLSEDDRVCAFICYASILGKERRMKEANKVLAHAKVMFAGSPQEVQVLIAASQLYVEKGDFDSAIRMLDKVSVDSPSFSRAQIAKAEIILKHNHDKEGFTRCYSMLVEKDPNNPINLMLLGEAYLKILNPDSAIDALERAYKLDPYNTRLRAKIGRALVATHEYHRAVDFYESALREAAKTSVGTHSESLGLSHDLAKLYLRLGRLESASRVLTSALIENPRDVSGMKQNVSTLLLISSVQQLLTPDEVNDSLSRAYHLQKDILIKTRSNTSMATTTSEQVEAEKQLLSELCDKLGNFYFGESNFSEAERYFQEGIQQNLQNITAMIGLARIFLQRKEYEQCLNQCNKVITAMPGDRDGAILAAEVLVLMEQLDRAVEIMTNFMTQMPNDYIAMERAISLLRKAGKLKLAQQFLTAAEKRDRRCLSHPGYHYCQGLFARFTNDIGKAISEFNLARKDDHWGPGALTHMIELYLNPDQEGVWEEKENGPVDDATRANIAAAEELLKELLPVAK